MDAHGIDATAFVLFLLNLIMVISWVIFTALGLVRLRRLALSEAQYLLWTAIVLFVPFFGSAAVMLRTSTTSKLF